VGFVLLNGILARINSQYIKEAPQPTISWGGSHLRGENLKIFSVQLAPLRGRNARATIEERKGGIPLGGGAVFKLDQESPSPENHLNLGREVVCSKDSGLKGTNGMGEEMGRARGTSERRGSCHMGTF